MSKKMKLLSRIGLGVLVVAGLLIIIGFLLPAKVYFSKSIIIQSSPAAAFVEINSLRRFMQWSVWRSSDPDADYTYSGPSTGVGATLKWKGEKVGTGLMTIEHSAPYESIRTVLYFDEQQQQPSYANFTCTPIGKDSVKIVWDFETDMGANPFTRYMGLFMEYMLGPAYTQSLQVLKELLESSPSLPIEEITMRQSMKVVGYKSSVVQDQSLQKSMESTFPQVIQLAAHHNLEVPTYAAVYFSQDTSMYYTFYMAGILDPDQEIETTQDHLPIEERVHVHTIRPGSTSKSYLYRAT